MNETKECTKKTHEYNKNTMLSFNYANWIPHSFVYRVEIQDFISSKQLNDGISEEQEPNGVEVQTRPKIKWGCGQLSHDCIIVLRVWKC